MFFKLGFRNLMRNKRRTIISVFSIGMGLMSLIIMDGFMTGMMDNMVKMTTSGLLGQAQIHHEKFMESQEAEYLIENLPQLENQLKQSPEVESWSKRVMTLTMISSARNSKNVMLYGIDPDNEAKVTTILETLQEGSFLKNSKGIVLGRKLFNDLNVRLGDKIVLTASSPISGELTQELFRVEGVLSFGSDLVDESMAFVNYKTLQKALGLGSDVHEIVFKLKSNIDERDDNLMLFKNLSQGQNLAQSWAQLSPAIAAAIDMSNISMFITGSILFVLVGIGIINTLFMAIYERIFEFGVIRALGTKSSEVLRMVFYEGLSLGVLASIFGVIFSLILGGYLSVKGVDYGGIEYNNMVFQEPIYFVFKFWSWIIYPLITIAFTAIVGLYPARFASKITLGHSLKKTL